MPPHSPHLPSLTGQSVNRPANGSFTWSAAPFTYTAYFHSQPPAGHGAPISGQFSPPSAQNRPFSPSKTAILSLLPVQKVPGCEYFLHLSEFSYFHLRHLQPLMIIYTPAHNPHLHTYPPFKGGKCEWWEGDCMKRYNFTQEVQVLNCIE
jgi:hypothetical protein